VGRYTQCELTKEDKLLAVSGIARLMHERFGDEYVAGLWKSLLLGGLCWRVDRCMRTTRALQEVVVNGRDWADTREV
jgi:hypothetical protein